MADNRGCERCGSITFPYLAGDGGGFAVRFTGVAIAHGSYGTEVPLAAKYSILRPACYNKFKDRIGQ